MVVNFITPQTLWRNLKESHSTHAHTQFALIEFSARTSWKEIHSGLSNVLRAGVTPIVAHIERYDALEENLIVFEKSSIWAAILKSIAHMSSNQSSLALKIK